MQETKLTRNMGKVQINNTPGSEDWKEHWKGVTEDLIHIIKSNTNEKVAS